MAGGLQDGLGGGTNVSGVEDQMTNDLLMSSTNRIYFRDSGLNIYSSADGTLDVTADTTLALAGTTSITLTGTTVAVSGALTTDGNITNTLGAGEAITITATNTGTGAIAPFVYTNTQTGVGSTGGRALFQLNANAALGGWANALKAYTVLATAGSVSGLGSAMCAEMLLPGASLSTGSYGVLELELVTQASGSYTSPIGFMWMQVSGNSTATGTWEDSGYLMIIKGLSEGTGNIFSAGADVAAAATLRILVGSTAYYILLGAGESN